jgi:hypothetical protein
MLEAGESKELLFGINIMSLYFFLMVPLAESVVYLAPSPSSSHLSLQYHKLPLGRVSTHLVSTFITMVHMVHKLPKYCFR